MGIKKQEIDLGELESHISEFANKKVEVNKDAKHYVDNDKLYEAFKVWIPMCKEAKAQGKPRPQIPDFIAQAIMDTCNNLTRRHNFFKYTSTWKENMIGDAIIACVKYVHNFDPEQYNKPFAYITRIADQAFKKRLEKENKEYYFKLKMFEMNGGHSNFSDDIDVDNNAPELQMYDNYHERIAKFEQKMENRKQEKKEKELAAKAENEVDITTFFN